MARRRLLQVLVVAGVLPRAAAAVPRPRAAKLPRAARLELRSLPEHHRRQPRLQGCMQVVSVRQGLGLVYL